MKIKHLFGVYDHKLVFYRVAAPYEAFKAFSRVVSNTLNSAGIDNSVICGFFSDDKMVVKWDGDDKIELYEAGGADGNLIIIRLNGCRTWIRWQTY